MDKIPEKIAQIKQLRARANQLAERATAMFRSLLDDIAGEVGVNIHATGPLSQFEADKAKALIDSEIVAGREVPAPAFEVSLKRKKRRKKRQAKPTDKRRPRGAPITQEKLDKARLLRGQGWSWLTIAKELGTSDVGIMQAIKRADKKAAGTT